MPIGYLKLGGVTRCGGHGTHGHAPGQRPRTPGGSSANSFPGDVLGACSVLLALQDRSWDTHIRSLCLCSAAEGPRETGRVFPLVSATNKSHALVKAQPCTRCVLARWSAGQAWGFLCQTEDGREGKGEGGEGRRREKGGSLSLSHIQVV